MCKTFTEPKKAICLHMTSLRVMTRVKARPSKRGELGETLLCSKSGSKKSVWGHTSGLIRYPLLNRNVVYECYTLAKCFPLPTVCLQHMTPLMQIMGIVRITLINYIKLYLKKQNLNPT